MIAPASGLPAYTLPPSAGPSTYRSARPVPDNGAPAAGEDDAQTSGGPIFLGGRPPAGNPARSRPGGTYGVGAPAGVRDPFGGPASQVSTPPAATSPHGGVPQQRIEGTVYGGRPTPDSTMPVSGHPADMTMPVSSHPADMTMPVAGHPADMTMPVPMNFNAALENSGSLTGHILAQGWDRGVDTNRRSNVKVGIAMLLVLVFLVGVSVLFLFTAGDAFTDMVNGVFAAP
jgi:hypothetical protein